MQLGSSRRLSCAFFFSFLLLFSALEPAAGPRLTSLSPQMSQQQAGLSLDDVLRGSFTAHLFRDGEELKVTPAVNLGDCAITHWHRFAGVQERGAVHVP